MYTTPLVIIYIVIMSTENKEIYNKFKHLRPFGLIIMIVAIAGFLISGCESERPQAVDIGILLFGDSRQPQVDGFIHEMEKGGYGQDSANYIILNAKNNRKTLPGMLDDLISKKPDLLVAAGGLEADIMKKVAGTHNIPVIVLYVNAIIERGLVNSRTDTGWNATGVDNLNAELSGKRIELIKDLLPETSRVLILYYERIAPSRIGVKEAKAVAKKMGITIDARAVNSRQDIKKVMSSIKPGTVDVMLTVPTAPIDNALKSIILPDIERLNIPLFTHSRPLAELGALASYGADFYELGQQSARLAKKVLSGVAGDHIPFEIPKNFKYTINKDVQNRLSIKIKESSQHQINDIVTTRQ